ncbi:Eco57I restriction-modification methylase domain-containing protein [Flavobacterium taihuense]|uniref:site-specific DNA-methyltransferase (adenine-specific) n=1 Tax=Flavobacterium taihuense TaxID=2857508 RepID=A0ABS6Y2E6_9FLAO|nr:N-6 DNA methylase [Flavobacterium taihuense]MBW4362701.1 N-6 DNA methylase [Flavobacterium taihuense]
MKLNERAWAGQIISWIKQSINDGTTLFQDATNDEGLKLASGRTKFPDVLLFIDKISGIVFNGWELKFPDTEADNTEMLENALEKAERLQSDSFVTWNGTEAIIWKINDDNYSLSGLEKLKVYPKEKDITNRNDLADRNNYNKHEAKLQNRLNEILHDLGQLYKSGELKRAINISSNIVDAVLQTAQHFIPQLKNEINELKGDDRTFRTEFNQWKIIESATLKILSTSSRRVENVEPEEVLAKFTYYKLIGKVLFYLTLSENLSGKVSKLELKNEKQVQKQLNDFFNQAKKIDYQAVFESDFTDKIPFNETINELLFRLVSVFNEFDFKVLPTEVIGYILENLVPQEEKQKFGQYFTSETLANLVTFSAIKSRNDVVIDPTSGTGTFLNSFYNTLQFFGNKNHQQILNQIWGNDISHFPATLSVINLYKQKVDDTANFPRIIRKDFFTLTPTQTIPIPDNTDINKINHIPIPKFDAVISNFPFIQQEDIPNDILNTQFESEFAKTQKAFLNGSKFDINGKSDYYIYCFYNSLKFLKDNGALSAITSNAWLGKNYGLQFKIFLLDNFHIKYVVKSNAEHWFKDSKVSTIFITLEKSASKEPTKFITVNEKLEVFFKDKSLQSFEDFYTEVDNCNNPKNTNWKEDTQFKNVFQNTDGTITVSIVEQSHLINSLVSQENWATYFVNQNPLGAFEKKLINPFPSIYDTGRGTRTGWDEMHIISNNENKALKIEKEFLLPILKTSQELKTIAYSNKSEYNLFVCKEDEKTLKAKYPNAHKHIKKFETTTNKTGIALPKVLKVRKPFWYSLAPEESANIFISINPSQRLFFSFSKSPLYLNQRLVAIRVKKKDTEIVSALLNSIVSLLIVELNGVSRNLGALDLNADFFKTKMKMFDPSLLSDKQAKNISSKFEILSKRQIQDYENEYKQKDRIEFDEAVLKAYGFKTDILPHLYSLLTDTIRNRVELKNR